MKVFQKGFKYLILIVFIMTFHSYSQPFPPPGTPLANGEHPRLVFTDVSLQNTIQPYISNHESANFQAWISTLDAAYNDQLSGKQRALLLADAMNFAFLSYAVHSGYFSGFSFSHTAQEYANKAYQHAVEISGRDLYGGGQDEDNITKDSEGWNASLALGCVYDWCFDYLSTSEKQIIADELIEIQDWSYSFYGVADSENIVGESSGRLWCWLFMPTVFLGDNLGSSYNSEAQEATDLIPWFFEDRQMKLVEQIYEGKFGYPGGISYTTNLTGTVSWFWACYNSMLDGDITQEYPWIATIPWYYRYKIEPKYSYEPGRGNAEGYWYEKSEVGTFSNVGGGQEWHMLIGLANFLKNTDPDIAGWVRWLHNSNPRFEQYFSYSSDQRRTWLWYRFLLGMLDVAERTPTQANLPLSLRLGEGRTWFLSDLNTESATKIGFICPQYTYGGVNHDHRDVSQITIFKNGTLWIDAGHNKAGGLPRVGNWHSEPISHNLIGFYNGSNTKFEIDPGTTLEANYNAPANQPGGANNIGVVRAIDLNGVDYDFVDYDYTRWTKGSGFADSLFRKILYIRDPSAPNYTNKEWLLIYDDISLNDGNYKRWFTFHTANAPEVNGDILKITNDMNDAGGSGSTPNTFDARMFTKVLLPSNYSIQTITGSINGSGDFTNWYPDADGTSNIPSGGTLTADNWAASWAGRSTTFLKHTTGSASEFLVVNQICGGTFYESMSPVTKIDVGDFVGALMNEERIAFFNRNAAPNAVINYNFSSNKPVKHFITGLESGLYYIRVDGNLISGVNNIVDQDNGILYFEHSGGGNFVISKSSDTTPPGTPSGLRITK